MSPDFRQYRFEANMPLEQHRHFNNILNETVKRTQARDYKVKPDLLNICGHALLKTLFINRENV